MLNQTPAQLIHSSAFDAIRHGAVTKIFMCSPRADIADLEKIGLTSEQAALVRVDQSQRQAVCISDQSVVELNLDLRGLGEMLDVLAGSHDFKNALPDGWRQNPDFWRGDNDETNDNSHSGPERLHASLSGTSSTEKMRV
jgi:type IV secretion system protein VirB4